MSGIYIHIPFCKQACYYCDFHFSTNTSRQVEMVDAICQELTFRKDYLQSPVKTIYFGGGTPSLLTDNQLIKILSTVYQHYFVDISPEITLEANPDDLNRNKLLQLKKAGINRLSIGIQSFHEPHLKFMHRAHSSNEAETCVKQAQDCGFDNITIDLIYAIPGGTHQLWEKDLNKAIALHTQHISSYCLTIEEKTVFGNWNKKGQLKPKEDEYAARQFEIMVERLTHNGFEHYEVSNFALPGYYSQHNSNYWKQTPYLGIGPGAHSFNLQSRQYNVSSNAQYLKALQEGTIPATKEILSKEDQINEYLLTSLRTQWGCNTNYLLEKLHWDLLTEKAAILNKYQKNGYLSISPQNIITLETKGKLIADQITADLFV
ncbi:radical SAM family heme chaperone HemW [Rapidithrix thailandica]|uniref:Heme chaperone HemW n=1 Tax=Rapidithrix thailandica TaxID=413964 RepID=A0AAW9S5V3_9BACT